MAWKRGRQPSTPTTTIGSTGWISPSTSTEELVELVALAGTAPLRINFLLFMTDPPPPREQSCKVDSLAFRVSPDASGDVHLSWISENPAPTRLEYGAGDFSCAYESPALTLLHRAVLRGLDKDKQYSRAVGQSAGQPVYSETIRFARCDPDSSVAETRRIPLVLSNLHPTAARCWLAQRRAVPARRPRLGKEPAASGQRPAGAASIRDRLLAGHSVKWVLLTFVADCPAQARYELSMGPVQPAWKGGRCQARWGHRRRHRGGSFRITPQGELLRPTANGLHSRPAQRRAGHKTGAAPQRSQSATTAPSTRRSRARSSSWGPTGRPP